MKKKFKYKNQDLVLDTDTLEISVPNGKYYNFFNKQLNRYYVSWIVDGVPRMVPRARLICQAYHPLSDEDLQHYVCDHIDSNTVNDDPSNLRWLTKKQNNTTQHATKLRKQNATFKQHQNEVIKATNKKTNEISYFSNGHVAANNINCTHVLVYNVLNKKHFAKSAKGWLLEWVKVEKEFKDDLISFENLLSND